MSNLKLPEWRELSRDEQIEIINLPTDRTYFVRGGPGTGKSMLAIHRVARLRDLEPESKCKLLVYNKPLQLYIKDALLATELDSSIAQTCHSWIYQMTGIRPPSNVWNYDWAAVSKIIEKHTGWRKLIDHLIIDEAQDIPRPLLDIFSRISENATIFVDDKQAISESAREHGLCQLAGIRSIFEQGPNRTFDLTRNFRNSQQILEAAHALRPPQMHEVPDRAIRQDGPRPTFRHASIDDTVRRIEAYHTNNPADRIGIAVPRARDREVFAKVRESEVPTQLYTNQNARDGHYSASQEGATVLSYDMMKGLEFDAVFMFGVNDSRLHSENTTDTRETNQNIVYVVSTRARSFLEYSHEGDMPSSWLTNALNSACDAGYVRRP